MQKQIYLFEVVKIFAVPVVATHLIESSICLHTLQSAQSAKPRGLADYRVTTDQGNVKLGEGPKVCVKVTLRSSVTVLPQGNF